MSKKGTAREKILKKIRNALLNQVDNPFNDADFEAPLITSSTEAPEVNFATIFIQNGGDFFFCENPKDFVHQLMDFFNSHELDKIEILEEDLRHLFEKFHFDKYSIDKSSPHAKVRLSMCEGLIGSTGSILLSTDQKETPEFWYNCDHLIFVASIKHIMPTFQFALEALKKKQTSLPSQIISISKADELGNHFHANGPGIFGPKKLSLFLIDQ